MFDRKDESVYFGKEIENNQKEIVVCCKEDNEFTVAYNSTNLDKLDNINLSTDKFIILEDEENFPIYIKIDSVIGISIEDKE